MFCGYAVERAKERLKAEKEDLSLLTEVAGHLECLEPGKEISDTIVSFYIQ